MATVESVTIDDETNTVTIESLTLQDADLTEFLTDTDPADREDAVAGALRIGASALELVETSKEAEFVERRFAEMEGEFESQLEDLQRELDDRFGDDGELARILETHLGEDGHLAEHLEDAFGEDGQFVERLEDELGEDGEKIQQALDPDREGTPTYRLKQRLVEELETVKQRVDEDRGEQEIREQTRLKGFDWEDQLQRLLEDLVHQTPNRVRDTSEETGAKGDSKKGDFVIELDETGQRIVVEAKNGDFPETVDDEMTAAIENREADYGILVASSLEYLPRTKVGWFSEVDQDYVVVALSDQPDDEIEPRFLKFAYHWARTRTLLSHVAIDDSIDPEAVKSELDGIEDAIGRFQQIRTKCSDLEESVNDIRELLQEIDDEVTTRINQLEGEVSGTRK